MRKHYLYLFTTFLGNIFAQCCDCCCCCLTNVGTNKSKKKKTQKIEPSQIKISIDEVVKKMTVGQNSDNPHVKWKFPWCWLCGGLNMLASSKTFKNFFFDLENIKQCKTEKEKKCFYLFRSVLKSLDEKKVLKMSDEFGYMVLECLDIRKKVNKEDPRIQQLYTLFIGLQYFDFGLKDGSFFDVCIEEIYKYDDPRVKKGCVTEGEYDISKILSNIIEGSYDVCGPPKCIILNFNYQGDNWTEDWMKNYFSKVKIGKLPMEVTIKDKKYKLKSFGYVGFNIPYSNMADLGSYSVIDGTNEFWYNEMGKSARKTLDECMSMKLYHYNYKFLDSMLYEIDD